MGGALDPTVATGRNLVRRALAEHGRVLLRFDFTVMGRIKGDIANADLTCNVDHLLAAGIVAELPRATPVGRGRPAWLYSAIPDERPGDAESAGLASALAEVIERTSSSPRRDAIDAGVDVVMSAHIALPGLDDGKTRPATVAPNILTGVLRDSLGFRGLTVTDALNMAGVWRLPVVFVVSNNQWAISLPRAHQTAAETLAQRNANHVYAGRE